MPALCSRLRRAVQFMLFFVVLLHSLPASAGLSLATSVGVGGQIHPQQHYQATNLMLAVGYDFAGLLRPELGLVGTLEQIRGGNITHAGWELRPMLVFEAPLLPLYARLVFAAVDLFSSDLRAWAYGGALGLSLGVLGLHPFVELGVLPRAFNTLSARQLHWVLEGRAGVTLGF